MAARCVVSVRRQDHSVDMDLPIDQPVSRLSGLILSALGWPADAPELYCPSLGRRLQGHETLSSARVLDACELQFLAPGEAPPAGREPAAQSAPCEAPASQPAREEPQRRAWRGKRID